MINGFPVSNFANFCFAPQTQILIYIFLNVAQCDWNLKTEVFIYVSFFSFRNNLKSLSLNDFPVSKLANFGFAPQTQILIYIFFIVAQCDCNQKPKSLYMSLF